MLHEELQYSSINQIYNNINSDPFPKMIEIHPTDMCNQKCDYCFHGGVGYNKTRANEILSVEHYQQLFKEMNYLKIENLSISGGGEPLLDKRIYKIIEIALTFSLKVRLVTNGNYLYPNKFALLSNIEELRISLDAINPVTYAFIRKVKQDVMMSTLDNIRSFVLYKEDNNKNVKIGVTFLINTYNIEEVFGFCEAMINYGVDHIIVKYDIYGKYFIDNKLFINEIDKIETLQNDKIEIRDETVNPIPKFCFVPYFKVAFNPYGELYSCCLASQPNEQNGYLFGSIKNSTFAELWLKTSANRQLLYKDGVTCRSCNYTDIQINSIINQQINNKQHARH